MKKRRKNFDIDDFKEWFKSLAVIDENGCWNWPMQKKDGYGHIRYKRKMYFCHRLAFRLFVRELSKTEIVRHKCHNRSCYNPEHLSPGSHSQNAYDSRHYHSQTKLTEDKVREIRVYYSEHKKFAYGEAAKSYEILAEKYGVSSATIKAVRFNVQWKDVA